MSRRFRLAFRVVRSFARMIARLRALGRNPADLHPVASMYYYSEARTLHFERRGAERSGVTESLRVRQKPDALARACPGFAARVHFYEASRQISALRGR